MNEPDLIARAQRGDGAAWEALMCTHQEAAFRLAYLLVRDPADADDVAQEAFVRAYHALDRFDTARPFRPWLLRITANLARNRRRAVARALAALRRLLRAAPEPESRLDRVARREAAEALWEAVSRLGSADQEIIYLRYFLELPVEETAATLGIATGTVKSRLSRALGRLRTVVEGEFPELREGYEDGPVRV